MNAKGQLFDLRPYRAKHRPVEIDQDTNIEPRVWSALMRLQLTIDAREAERSEAPQTTQTNQSESE